MRWVVVIVELERLVNFLLVGNPLLFTQRVGLVRLMIPGHKGKSILKMKRSARGFTLIEALVALAVLSFGLLGAAAMQLKALQSAHMGYQRSMVSLVAIDAQERAWAELSRNNGVCPDDASTTTIMGKWVSNWSDHLAITSDPSPLVKDSTKYCEYEVSITWSDERFSDGEAMVPFDYRFKLP